MKHFAMLLLLALAGTYAMAQDEYQDNEIRTLFSSGQSNGFYGAFTIGYTQIESKDAIVAGGRFAYIIDHAFAIGIGGTGFANNLDYHSWYNDQPFTYSLAGGYGGIVLEPIVGGMKPVHLAFPVLFGIGGAALIDTYGYNHWDANHPFYDLDNDVVFVVEPAVEVEFNLTRFFRAAVSASYRYTSDVDLFATDPDVLKGFSIGTTFKFGKF